MAAPGPKKRRRIDDTASLPPNHTFPLPSKRFRGQKPPRNRSLKISDEAADVVITRAFHQRLVSEIISMAKATAASNQKLAEDEVLEKFDEQKTKLLQNDRVPRGLYEQADKIGGYPSQTTYLHFRKQNSIVARWRIFVTENFHQNIQYALTKYSEFAEEICQRSNTLTGGTRIRTCEVPLSKVIRSDLPSEHQERFKQRLQETAIMLTNASSDLSAIIRAMMLECGRVGFKPTPDTQYVVLREESKFERPISVNSCQLLHSERKNIFWMADIFQFQIYRRNYTFPTNAVTSLACFIRFTSKACTLNICPTPLV